MPTLTTLAVDLQPSKQGTIAWLTINRPEALNALSGELLREFALLMDYWSHPYSLLDDEAALPKDHPRVIILQSAGGKAFSSGVDIKVGSRAGWTMMRSLVVEVCCHCLGAVRRYWWPMMKRCHCLMNSHHMRLTLPLVNHPASPLSYHFRPRPSASAASPGTITTSGPSNCSPG